MKPAFIAVTLGIVGLTCGEARAQGLGDVARREQQKRAASPRQQDPIPVPTQGQGAGPSSDAPLSDDPAVLERECAAGSARACSKVGTLYLTGQGVAKDARKAGERFDEACRLKLGEGCHNRAYVYLSVAQTPENLLAAMEKLAQTCGLGFHRSCHTLGTMYLQLPDGVRTHEDEEAAATMLERACGADIADACFNRGWMYDRGRGGPQSARLALEYLRRACRLGSEKACNTLRETGRSLE
jgi:TPR repeat protein